MRKCDGLALPEGRRAARAATTATGCNLASRRFVLSGMNSSTASAPLRLPAPRPPVALLLAVAILGVASLLPRISPAWFAAPPERVNFLGTGAPFLLFLVLRPRWSWAWRLTQSIAVLSACAALAVGLWLTHGYLVGWSAAAVLCALAFAILTWSGAVRDYFSHRRS